MFPDSPKTADRGPKFFEAQSCAAKFRDFSCNSRLILFFVAFFVFEKLSASFVTVLHRLGSISSRSMQGFNVRAGRLSPLCDSASSLFALSSAAPGSQAANVFRRKDRIRFAAERLTIPPFTYDINCSNNDNS